MIAQHGRLIFTALLALATCDAVLGTIIIQDGGVNVVNSDPQEDFEILNGPGDATTTVNVEAPAAIGVNPDDRSIGVFQNSVLNMTGGIATGTVVVSDNSVASLSGTAAVGGDVLVDGSAQVTLDADVTVSGEVLVEGIAHVDFLGGEVDTFGVDGDATATVNGGSIDDDMDAVGNGVLTVIDVFVNDDVDAEDDGVMHLMGGIFDEDVEAADDSTINITGGEFVRIFSDGASMVASGGTVHAIGGVMGEAGENGGGSVLAAGSPFDDRGLVIFDGVEVAGTADGTAPEANFSAVGGDMFLSNMEFTSPTNLVSQVFGVLEADNLTMAELNLASSIVGEMRVSEFSADNVDVSITGGAISLSDGTTGPMNLVIDGGTFSLANVSSETLNVESSGESVVTIIGSFSGNSGPLESAGLLRSNPGSEIRLGGLGDDFKLNGVPVSPGPLNSIGGLLEGVSVDGTPFSFFVTVAPGGSFTLLAVPEPASVLLVLFAMLGFTAAVCTKKVRN